MVKWRQSVFTQVLINRLVRNGWIEILRFRGVKNYIGTS